MMLNKITVPQYEFDPTGSLPANKCIETHTLSVTNPGEYSILIPRRAPFFNHSIRIRKIDTDETLVYGKDYLLGGSFPELTLSIKDNEPVCGVIVFQDLEVHGNFEVTYQTVGGDFVLDEQEFIEILRNKIVNPFSMPWGEIVNKPMEFPPAYHGHHTTGLDDYRDHVNAFNRLIDAIEEMVDRDVTDRPDYRQVIITMINQGRTVRDIADRLTVVTDAMQENTDAQIKDTINKIKDLAADTKDKLDNMESTFNNALNDLDNNITNIINAEKEHRDEQKDAIDKRFDGVDDKLAKEIKDRVKDIADVNKEIKDRYQELIRLINGTKAKLERDHQNDVNRLQQGIDGKVNRVGDVMTGQLGVPSLKIDSILLDTRGTADGTVLTVNRPLLISEIRYTSDVRKKENIKPLHPEFDIRKLKPVKYNFIGNENTSYGVIAQELEKVLPELVYEDLTGIKSVDYQGLSMVLLSEQIKNVDKICKMSEEMEELKRKFKEIEERLQ